MIKEFFIEQLNPNDTEFLVVDKNIKNGDYVEEGDILFVAEGQKAAIDVEAEVAGYFYSSFKEGEYICVDKVAYAVFSDKDGIEDYISAQAKLIQKKASNKKRDGNSKEEQLGDEAGFELALLHSSEIKVAVLPGGRAYRQVEDAVVDNPNIRIVGYFDDTKDDSDPLKLGSLNVDEVSELVDLGVVDRVFVATGDYKLRTKLLNRLTKKKIKTINIIHPSAQISDTACIGSNVFIGPQVCVSAKSYIDNGAFISALSNVEHHCKVGENTLLGPGVMLSGSVNVGKRTVLGAGVAVESKISIGDDVYVSPGHGVSKHLRSGSRLT